LRTTTNAALAAFFVSGGRILRNTMQHPRPGISRLYAASGCLLAALSVALAAYASHGLTGEAQSRLVLASAFAFAHGLALAALAGHTVRITKSIALGALLLGTVLFSGSLAGAALRDHSTALAPLGGMLLIGGWLLLAVHSLRR
jgi:uncharacterized membrane protein YgdD (TMEM256/DUF423 family)